MKVLLNPINQNRTMALNQENVSFKGKNVNLTRLFREKFGSKSFFLELMRKCPDINRNIGSLPVQWIRDISKYKALIQLRTREIQEAFADFAFFETFSRRDIAHLEKAMKILSSKLTAILGKNVSVEYFGSGWIGNVYKITCGQDKFALKTFNPPSVGYNDYFHGQIVEPIIALYASKRSTKGAFSKFFMGRAGGGYDKDAYMLTQFIDDSNARKSRIKNDMLKRRSDIVIHVDDRESNKINDTVVDYGCVTLNDKFRHPEERKIARLLMEALDTNNPEKVKATLAKYHNSKYLQKVKDSIKNLYEFYANLKSRPEEAIKALGITL